MLFYAPYKGNTVGSAMIGFMFFQVEGAVMAASDIKAYSCKIGQMGSSSNINQILYEKFIIADCGRAITFNLNNKGDDNYVILRNSYIAAVSRPGCV